LSDRVPVVRVLAAAALAGIAFWVPGCAVDRLSPASGYVAQSRSSEGAEAQAILIFPLLASQLRIYDPPSHAATVVPQRDANLQFSGATYLDGRGNLFESTFMDGRDIEVYSPPYVDSPKLIPLVDNIGVSTFAESPVGVLFAIGQRVAATPLNFILQYPWPYNGHPPKIIPIKENLTGKVAIVDRHNDLLLIACCTGSDFGELLLVYPPPYSKVGRTIRLPGRLVSNLFKGRGDAILVSQQAKSGKRISILQYTYPYDDAPQVSAPFGDQYGPLAISSHYALFMLAGNRLTWSKPGYASSSGSVVMALAHSKFVQQIAFDRNDDLFVVKSFGVHSVGQQQRFELSEFAPPYGQMAWSTGIRSDPENEPPGVLYLSP
jgi:hypothetical protein